MDTDEKLARKTFELENEIKPLINNDEMYNFDAEEQKKILNEKPWTTDPKYFTNVKISSMALMKMVLHAKSGGDIEVMGLMQGKIKGQSMIVMDAFALPVEGTETRVNAAAEGYEYMVDYMTVIKQAGKQENVIGWYHSHPGYGCWLSGIDVSTQHLNQQFQEPFLAVVIDPKRTSSTGKVDLGAFRTFPEDYKAPSSSNDEFQQIPMDKIEDFGVHSNRYYSLPVSYFKSSFDERFLEILWSQYWMNNLSSSPILGTEEFLSKRISDLASKLKKIDQNFDPTFGKPKVRKEDIHQSNESQLHKCCKESNKISIEYLTNYMQELLKAEIFN
ncbi:JAB1/Mov34/MPN/PAD-1 domain-containing protein [Rozella allomycis CSF55]|uniref:COP9 signalosome complex subunit 5 n=1 Tax=Rozella allomycis (strain CSF55) TaxID=988480 RepID=A0A075ASM1_ROZAC|nr:JAB1/Mov34/MPN/PAD-1 domain-containing protein [Rozella allomycis CSF55]|eukprot:EPZ33258.1 JAB1/Mov34/MPN/PAD-1 domain-containing protein [Rozella allomycis CSF55]